MESLVSGVSSGRVSGKRRRDERTDGVRTHVGVGLDIVRVGVELAVALAAVAVVLAG